MAYALKKPRLGTSPKELEQLVRDLGFNYALKILEVSERTLRRWLDGQGRIPAAAMQALYWLSSDGFQDAFLDSHWAHQHLVTKVHELEAQLETVRSERDELQTEMEAVLAQLSAELAPPAVSAPAQRPTEKPLPHRRRWPSRPLLPRAPRGSSAAPSSPQPCHQRHVRQRFRRQPCRAGLRQAGPAATLTDRRPLWGADQIRTWLGAAPGST
ncbi:hypothetical protein AZ34_10540 [Hylemonella gracilis str. Niagara R]|uniref:DNA-binding protein n=1 Tax=Hylemonella gracilis str. Niagara R TaxID=1458275 RepID=A0A016XLU1_9BURK|nr:hypothetical protein [Hylemonella gracilis]EYC52875.1 hypothetical protein AZ34_10540 [Hylemonella gracilis str. Niagara R]